MAERGAPAHHASALDVHPRDRWGGARLLPVQTCSVPINRRGLRQSARIGSHHPTACRVVQSGPFLGGTHRRHAHHGRKRRHGRKGSAGPPCVGVERLPTRSVGRRSSSARADMLGSHQPPWPCRPHRIGSLCTTLRLVVQTCSVPVNRRGLRQSARIGSLCTTLRLVVTLAGRAAAPHCRERSPRCRPSRATAIRTPTSAHAGLRTCRACTRPRPPAVRDPC